MKITTITLATAISEDTIWYAGHQKTAALNFLKHGLPAREWLTTMLRTAEMFQNFLAHPENEREEGMVLVVSGIKPSEVESHKGGTQCRLKVHIDPSRIKVYKK